jgi:hypothetical protein
MLRHAYVSKYDYVAVNGEGQTVRGQMVGQSETEVITALIADGLNPTKVMAVGRNGVEVPAYIQRKQGQQVMVIPVSIALMGFVGYASHTLELDWKTTLAMLSVPAVWLVLAIWSYSRYRRLARANQPATTEG